MSAETIVLALLIAVVLGLALRVDHALHPPVRRRHSWLYRHYMKSHLWRFRRWLWYWTSSRRCEECHQKMVLHRRGLRWRLGAEVMTVHHRNYRRLGHEHRSDVRLLCWPCHSAKDAWRHR